MAQHSRLAPSAANQWVPCPGSVQLQEQYPRTDDGQDAQDGRTAHLLAAAQLGGLVGAAASLNPSLITTEIRDVVEIYTQAIRTVVGAGRVLIEHEIQAPSVHAECWGTADAVWFDASTRILHVWDLKFGWGIVESFRNQQLLIYALGMAESITADAFHLHIIQPRPFHIDGPVRTWVVPISEVPDYVDRLQQSAQDALGDNPSITTGPHCRYCTALHACPSAGAAVLNAIDVTGRAVAPTPTPDEIGFRLTILRRAAEIVNHSLSATEQAALALDQSGTNIPGWTRGFTAGRTEWVRGKDKEIRAMAGLLGATVDKPAALVTPTQAIKAGLPADVVAMYCNKKPGRAKMEPINQDKIKQLLGGAT